MKPELRPVRIDTASRDEEGLLVFVADRLVAVLVKLSEQHGSEAGQWFLEHGFGHLDDPKRPTFIELDAAKHWIEERLASR
jgi:hypothetical protein